MEQAEQAESNKLYVGNLPYSINNDQLRELFASYGEISEAIVITDKFSGRSKGFGFVTFNTVDDAKKGAEAMSGKDMEGRNIVVNFARPMEKKFDNN